MPELVRYNSKLPGQTKQSTLLQDKGENQGQVKLNQLSTKHVVVRYGDEDCA